MRKIIQTATLFPAALVFASCGSAQSGGNAPAASRPAAGGAAAAGEPVALEGEVPFTVTAHGMFNEPWALKFEPGTQRIFITEKHGTMKVYDAASGSTAPVSGMPDDVSYGGQGGFADVAFAPDYQSSHTVYLSWVTAEDGDKRYGVIGRGTLSCADLSACAVQGLKVIWRQQPSMDTFGQFSLRITFSPDGKHMFVASGEYAKGDPAQDLSNNLGSILRLNLDGTAAAGNPFADRGSPTDQVWTYGHRNPLGLKFDLDGQLWDLEHGPRGGDEINRLVPGDNYGWPIVSNGINYNGTDIPDHVTRPEFHAPAISWTPVIAPGDFIFYSGRLWPEWRGQALATGLSSMALVRVKLSGERGTEEARYAFPNRMRDITEGPDGSLWLLEDGPEGRLLHLRPS